MTDREKLISLIKNIQDYGVRNEHGVSYICQHTLSPEAIADHLIAHGVTVREPKKPLTLEEAQSIWPRMAYVEKRGMEMAPYPVLLVQDADKEHIRALEFGRAWRLLLPVADYGRMYRLWDGLPTEKERRDARWTES